MVLTGFLLHPNALGRPTTVAFPSEHFSLAKPQSLEMQVCQMFSR